MSRSLVWVSGRYSFEKRFFVDPNAVIGLIEVSKNSLSSDPLTRVLFNGHHVDVGCDLEKVAERLGLELGGKS